MSITIKEPIKTVNGLLTKAIAAESQLLYEIQREDYIVESFIDSGTNKTRVRFGDAAGNITSEFTDGDLCYLKDVDNKITGIWAIEGVTFNGSLTFFDIDQPFIIGTGVPGYCNNITTRENYRLNVDVFTDTGIHIFDQTFVYVPNQAGILDFDVGGILSSYMKVLGLFSQQYYLNISEVWKDMGEYDNYLSWPSETVSSITNSTAFPGFVNCAVDDATAIEYYHVGKSIVLYTPGTANYPDTVNTVVKGIDPLGKLALDVAYNGAGGVGVLVYRDEPIRTTTLQAVLAQKQLLDKGGANMWENLLRSKNSGYFASFIENSTGGTGDGSAIYYEGVDFSSEYKDGDKINLTPISIVTISYLVVSVSDNGGLMQYNIDPAHGDVSSFFNVGQNALVPEGAHRIVGVSFSTQTEIVLNLAYSAVTPVNIINNEFNGEQIWAGGLLDIRGINYGGVPTSTRIFTEDIKWPLDLIGGNNRTMVNGGDVGGEAKLLTKFENPLIWDGWNRAVNALQDSEFTNRTGLSSPQFIFNDADINKITLPTPTKTATFSGGVKVQIFNIPKELPIDPLAEYIRVAVRDGNTSTILSETMFYKIEQECPNSIMLDWINSLGGVDQWLFTLLSVVNIETDAGVLAERPITSDIEFITRTKRRFARSFRQRINLRAVNLTLDQLIALEEIKHTESLRVYLTKNGSEFIDAVVIDNFTTTYEPDQAKHKIDITIEFPDDFRFERAKKY